MTLGDMQTQLRDEYGTTASEGTRERMYKAALNNGYEMVCSMYNWPWLLKFGTVTISAADIAASVYSWSLPSDCRGVVRAGINDIGKVLKHLDLPFAEVTSRVIEYMAKHRRGVPDYWCAFGNKLYLIPPPYSAGTINLFYYQAVTRMEAATDTPIFDSNYHWVLVDLARAHLSASDQYDPGIAAAARRRAATGIQNMTFTSADSQPQVKSLPWLPGSF